jgi:hypothetical protein
MAASPYNKPQWKRQLAGAAEIAAWAGVTSAQVTHWAKEEWWPAAKDELRMGRVWAFDEVKAVLEARGFPKAPYLDRYPSHRKEAA